MSETPKEETPDEAVHRLLRGHLENGFEFRALHVYTDADENPLYWKIRLKHPDSGEKLIFPMKLEKERFVLREPSFPNGKPLYRLHELARRPGEAVIVVEGEACVDALMRLGILATTSGAAKSAGKADWSPLAGRAVTIWPDNDAAGQGYASDVAKQLTALGCVACVIDVERLSLPEKGDCVDWLAAHSAATPDDIRALSTIAKETDEPSAAGWPPLAPFAEHDVPDFPLPSLPDWLRSFVLGLATSTQTPPDLAAMLSLAALAAALAKAARVALTTDWPEPLNLFVAVVLPPAARKSAVFSSVMAPIAAWEKAETLRVSAERREAMNRRDIAEARLRTAKEKAGKDPDNQQGTEQAVAAAALSLDRESVPPVPRIAADDATQEKLVGMMQENGGRIALLSPEGGVFEMMAGRYQNGQANLDVYLKGHAGDALRVDRVGRDSEFIEGPALTIGLAIQPDVLTAIQLVPGSRGRGLTGRFLFSLPPNNIGRREIEPPCIPPSVRDAYGANLTRLLRLRADARPEAAEAQLSLSPDAQSAFRRFRSEIEPRLAADLAPIADWAGKLPGAVARIAGLLQVASSFNTGTPIEGATMRNAIQIGQYLVGHAQAAFSAMGAVPAIVGAKAILSWIESNDLETFSRRDAQQALRSRFPKATDIDEPLEVLEERGFIREVSAPGNTPGRPASPLYSVRPDLRRSAHNAPSSETSEVCESATDLEERAAIKEHGGG